MDQKCTADQVKGSLAARHGEDVFVTECRIPGGVIYQSEGYIDAWAMKKSWKHPLSIGYEIKVERGDFLQDHKWSRYLDYCNEFYFVSPSKIIRPDETPESAGLLFITDSGKLYTKKKAPYRDVDPLCLSRIYQSILMNRVNITPRSTRMDFSNDPAYWEKMLQEKEERRIYGHRLRGRIRRMYEDKMKSIIAENTDLRKENVRLQAIKAELSAAGVDVSNRHDRRMLVQRAIGGDITDSLRSLQASISLVLQRLSE